MSNCFHNISEEHRQQLQQFDGVTLDGVISTELQQQLQRISTSRSTTNGLCTCDGTTHSSIICSVTIINRTLTELTTLQQQTVSVDTKQTSSTNYPLDLSYEHTTQHVNTTTSESLEEIHHISVDTIADVVAVVVRDELQHCRHELEQLQSMYSSSDLFINITNDQFNTLLAIIGLGHWIESLHP